MAIFGISVTIGLAVGSVRLSREFFGLGPFRAQEMSVAGDRVLLHEEVSAAYYQPLPAASLRADGRYGLEHEGRFAAAMSASTSAHTSNSSA